MITSFVALGGSIFCLKLVVINGVSIGGVGCAASDGVWCIIGIIICFVVVFRVIIVIMSGITWSLSSITLVWCGFQWFWMVNSSTGISGTVIIGVVASDLVIGDLSVISGCPVITILNGIIWIVVGTSCDVIHSWSSIGCGLKMDVVPGRVVEMVVEINGIGNGGIFYGQCGELCGVLHGFMPIILVIM